MGDQTERIELHIRRQRTELDDNMRDLKHRATRAVDWRRQVDARPMTMAGIAFGSGALLSLLVGGMRKPGPNHGDPANDAQAQPERVERGPQQWGLLKGALLGVAAARVGSALENVLPGFQEEYEKSRAAKERA